MCAQGLLIRDDLTPEALRRLARREHDRPAAGRMFAIANALEGMSRAEAARLAGMERQALRDAVTRYNAEGLSGLHNRPAAASGQARRGAIEQVVRMDPGRPRSRGRRSVVLDAAGVVPGHRGAVCQASAPGQPVARGAANGVFPAEGAPAPPIIRPGCAGGVSKGGLSIAVDSSKQAHPDKRTNASRCGSKMRRGSGRRAACVIVGGRGENDHQVCATNVTHGLMSMPPEFSLKVPK
jgi:hypothetical protein